MSLVDEMKSLRENIDASQAERTKGIGDLRKDTKNMLKDAKDMIKGFKKEHKEMAGVLSTDLNAYVTNIKKETNKLLADARTMMKGYGAELKERRAEVKGMHEAWTAGKQKKRRKKTEEETAG